MTSCEEPGAERLQELQRLNGVLQKRLNDYYILLNVTKIYILKVRLADYMIVKHDAEQSRLIEKYTDSMYRMLGYNAKEYEELFHYDLHQYFAGAYAGELARLKAEVTKSLREHRNSFTINMKMPTKHGFIYVGGTAFFTDYTAERQPLSFIAVYQDMTPVITEHKKLELAELELQKTAMLKIKNEELYRLIDGVPSGLGTLRIENGVPETELQLNRYFIDRVGISLSPDRYVNLEDFLFCLHPDDRERCREDFHAFLKSTGVGTWQYRFHSVGGYYYWGSVRATIAHVAEGLDVAYFVYTDIDEMKKAEVSLEEGRRNYERTVDDLQAAMWTYDIAAGRVYMGKNKATEELRKKYGWPEVFDHAPGSLLDTVEDYERDKYRKVFSDIAAGRDGVCEVWYKQRTGMEPRCERESYHVVMDKNGKPVKAYGIGINITAEKKVEERYYREMEYLRHNSSQSLLAKGHYNLTQNLVLEYENPGGKKLYAFPSGISYDAAYDGFLNLAYDEADRKEITDKLKRENLIRRYQQGEMQTTVQYKRTVAGQDPVWISMTVHTYMQPNNGDLELFSYAYDITKRQQLEQVMQLVSKSAFDYVGLIRVADSSFEFLEKTPAVIFPELHQRTPLTECCAYVREHFVDAGERAHFDTATSLPVILRELQTKQIYTDTYQRTEHGKTLCKQLDYMWFDQQAGIILAVRTDVTAAYERDRKQLAQIEAAKLAAERANEAKSAFLSSMSHDLRTPLNGVVGFTALALKEKSAAKKQEYLEKIDVAGQLLLDLINDTLELSRIESGKMTNEPEAVLAEALIPAVVTSLRPPAELKQLKLLESYPEQAGPAVWCDKLKVQKIALNLISNAIKYTPAGGTIKVSLAEVPNEVPECKYSLIVEDTGIGMSEAFMKNMYEPFSQEKRSEAANVIGTGLGLSLVKRYVDLLGGAISVTSRLHKGSRFVVSLPITEVDAGKVVLQNKKETEKRLAGLCVLLCDDQPMNIEIAGMLLKNKQMQVEATRNGKECLDKFAASQPRYYDAILMDMRMPVMDGLEATRSIRALDRADAKTIPIIAMTADAFDESIREAKAAGMTDYLTKPINPQKLYEALANSQGRL